MRTERYKEAAQRRAQDPEWRRRQQAGVNRTLARRYIVTSPEGRELEITNLRAFCREMGLTPSNMTAVARGRLRHSAGWRVRYAAEETATNE